MSIMELDLQKLSKKESFFNKDNSLVDFIVPFVNNYNPLVLLNELFVKYQKYKTGCPQYILDENHSLFLASSEKTEEIKALAIKMRNLYKEMIDVAYSENSKSNEECERLEKSIKNSLPRISWRNRKNCGDAKALTQNTFKINAETKSFGRSVIQGNSSNLPKGSIINPDGTVTSPIFNQEPIGAELRTTSGIDSEDKIKSLLNDLFYKKSVHDSLPKTQDGLKTSWDVCMDPYRSGRYSGVGIITSDGNIVGSVKGDINQLKKREKFPEFRITPTIHENGTMTTGYLKGLPFYVVGNKPPTKEELEFIKMLKAAFPTILPIKDKDLEFINKYVSKSDLRSLRNLSPNQYRNKLNKMIRESYKRTDKSELLQELIKVLNGK